MVFCRSGPVITVYHGDPWSRLPAGAEDWHACQDHSNSCHIPEGRKEIQKAKEVEKEGRRREGRREEEGRRKRRGGSVGGREEERESSGRKEGSKECGGKDWFAKVGLLMVFVTCTGVRVDQGWQLTILSSPFSSGVDFESGDYRTGLNWSRGQPCL